MVTKKSESIRTTLFIWDKHWERPLRAPSWKQMMQSRLNRFLSAESCYTYSICLSVDRMSLWNRPRDLLREVENEAAAIFEKIEYVMVWCLYMFFSISSLFFHLSHCGKHCSMQIVWLNCDGYKSCVCSFVSSIADVYVMFFYISFVFLIIALIIWHHCLPSFVFAIIDSNTTTVSTAIEREYGLSLL